MKADLYTKVVLTVIAVCLSILVLKDVGLVNTAYAKEASPNNVMDVRIVGISSYPGQGWEAVKVREEK